MRNLISLFFVLCVSFLSAQNVNYFEQLVDTLTSVDFFGRGYVKDGDRKAARFIASEFKRLDLSSASDGYLQPFDLKVNTFPNAVDFKVDGKTLNLGREYILNPSSPSVDCNFKLVRITEAYIKDKNFNPKKTFKSKNAIFLSNELFNDLRKNDLPMVRLLYNAGAIIIEKKGLLATMAQHNWVKSQ